MTAHHNGIRYVALVYHKNGKWGLPGGCINHEFDDNAVHTCVREVFEEARIVIQPENISRVFRGKLAELPYEKNDTIYVLFETEIDYFEEYAVTADPEVIKVRMFPLDDVLERKKLGPYFKIKYKDLLLLGRANAKDKHKAMQLNKIGKHIKQKRGHR
jgi:8-oxo-dGTP pyrophosphatase MutT (NUDIX family)